MTTYDLPHATAVFGLDEPGCTHVPQGWDYDFTIDDETGAELLVTTIRGLYPRARSLGN